LPKARVFVADIGSGEQPAVSVLRELKYAYAQFSRTPAVVYTGVGSDALPSDELIR
jgi:hypothetical protein